jgi:membrane protein DedA with SNARE-associated domain
VTAHVPLLLAAHGHHRFSGPQVDYVALALACALTWFVITGPGEAALIAAGIAAHGHVDLPSVLVVAWFGAMVGGIAGWLAGRHGGRTLMTAPGPLAGLRARMLRSGERVYARYGPLAVYLGPTWMAGINAMRAARFLPACAVAALVWVLTVGGGAYLVGRSIEEVVTDLGLAGVLAIVAVAATVLGLRAVRRRRRA